MLWPRPTFQSVQQAIAESREFDVRSGDGRLIHIYDDGDSAAPLLIYHHGTPLSGLLPSFWTQVARAEGVRLVSFDRAGYGGSDRHPGRRIADVVSDTETVADALGAERFLFSVIPVADPTRWAARLVSRRESSRR